LIRAAAATIALLLALLGASSAHALSLQPVGTFSHPIYVTSDPGNAGRLFVVEREGTIELVEDGIVSQFANLSSVVGCEGSCDGERGLMSIALSPDFDRGGRLYVEYANDADGTIHVDELVAKKERDGGELADISSLRPLLSIPHPTESNHNGGQLQFGPDGNLYISTGDGGGSDDQFHNAQNLKSPLGKILRIHPDPDATPPYTVPPDNPFDAIAGDYAPIWSYGLRNPFRFSFDSLSGDILIGDVGQGQREEIDLARSPSPGAVGGGGANYGWNCREGSIPGPATDPECATPPPGGFVDPVFDYSHEPAPGGIAPCAIIGGYVVRDRDLGGLYGRYLYGDLCTGELRSLNLANTPAGDRFEGIVVNGLNSFGEDSCGRLYVVEGSGDVSRLTGAVPASCPAAPQPAPTPERAKAVTPTIVGIKAQRRRVERGKRALLTVFVSPCTDRKGQSVQLLRNGHANGTRSLSRACTARFLPRIHGRTTFAAATREERSYLPGASRRLTIRIAHPKQRR
jgi:glucose/arabinose dehydrogenase